MLLQACTRECRRDRPRLRCVRWQRGDHAGVVAHGQVPLVAAIVIWHQRQGWALSPGHRRAAQFPRSCYQAEDL